MGAILNSKLFLSVLLICLTEIVSAQQNLIPDPGFESGSCVGLWGDASILKMGSRRGDYVLSLPKGTYGSGLELVVNGLKPHTTYDFKAWVKSSEGGDVDLGVKDFGSAQIFGKPIDAPTFTEVSLRFSTGVLATSCTLLMYNKADRDEWIYVDDLSLKEADAYEFELVWNDEFDVDGTFDTSKWVSEIGFVRNNEAQYYQPNNAVVKNGELVLFGKRETNFVNPKYNGTSSNWRLNRQFAEWTSGSINTRGKAEFLYGIFEIRAKVSNLPGTWPAIWSVGTDTNCSWPANGEIDIMENYHQSILGNFALGAAGGSKAFWDSAKIPVETFGGKAWTDQYHIWTLDWHEDRMAIYVDNILINDIDLNALTTFNSDKSRTCPGINPFRKPQLLMLNLALGGDQGGSTSQLPDRTEYLVDYVRVYQKK